MIPTVTLVQTTEDEDRRLVRILAALREHLKDELAYVAEDPADPRSTELSYRDMRRLYTWLWDVLTNQMALTHAREWRQLDPEDDTPLRATDRRFLDPDAVDMADEP
jgi:hypothetical protein